MPALSDEHVLTETKTHMHTSCFFWISGPLSEAVLCRQKHILPFYVSLSLSLSLSHSAFGSVWVPEGMEVVILDSDI